MISLAQSTLNRRAIQVILWSPAVAVFAYFLGSLSPVVFDSLGMHSLHSIISGIYSHTCHQIASRSFFVDDIQLGFCARCTGLYGALAITSIFTIVTSHQKAIGIVALGALCIPSLVDVIFGLSEQLALGNAGRLATGVLCGAGLALYTYPRLVSAIRYSLAPQSMHA